MNDNNKLPMFIQQMYMFLQIIEYKHGDKNGIQVFIVWYLL